MPTQVVDLCTENTIELPPILPQSQSMNHEEEQINLKQDAIQTISNRGRFEKKVSMKDKRASQKSEEDEDCSLRAKPAPLTTGQKGKRTRPSNKKLEHGQVTLGECYDYTVKYKAKTQILPNDTPQSTSIVYGQHRPVSRDISITEAHRMLLNSPQLATTISHHNEPLSNTMHYQHVQSLPNVLSFPTTSEMPSNKIQIQSHGITPTLIAKEGDQVHQVPLSKINSECKTATITPTQLYSTKKSRSRYDCTWYDTNNKTTMSYNHCYFSPLMYTTNTNRTIDNNIHHHDKSRIDLHEQLKNNSTNTKSNATNQRQVSDGSTKFKSSKMPTSPVMKASIIKQHRCNIRHTQDATSKQSAAQSHLLNIDSISLCATSNALDKQKAIASKNKGKTILITISLYDLFLLRIKFTIRNQTTFYHSIMLQVRKRANPYFANATSTRQTRFKDARDLELVPNYYKGKYWMYKYKDDDERDQDMATMMIAASTNYKTSWKYELDKKKLQRMAWKGANSIAQGHFIQRLNDNQEMFEIGSNGELL